jgi:hypothetical protein
LRCEEHFRQVHVALLLSKHTDFVVARERHWPFRTPGEVFRRDHTGIYPSPRKIFALKVLVFKIRLVLLKLQKNEGIK